MEVGEASRRLGRLVKGLGGYISLVVPSLQGGVEHDRLAEVRVSSPLVLAAESCIVCLISVVLLLAILSTMAMLGHLKSR